MKHIPLSFPCCSCCAQHRRKAKDGFRLELAGNAGLTSDETLKRFDPRLHALLSEAAAVAQGKAAVQGQQAQPPGGSSSLSGNGGGGAGGDGAEGNGLAAAEHDYVEIALMDVVDAGGGSSSGHTRAVQQQQGGGGGDNPTAAALAAATAAAAAAAATSSVQQQHVSSYSPAAAATAASRKMQLGGRGAVSTEAPPPSPPDSGQQEDAATGAGGSSSRQPHDAELMAAALDVFSVLTVCHSLIVEPASPAQQQQQQPAGGGAADTTSAATGNTGVPRPTSDQLAVAASGGVPAGSAAAAAGGSHEEIRVEADDVADRRAAAAATEGASPASEASAVRYQGPSPDEVALADAALALGFAFLGRTPTGVAVQEQGARRHYQLLNVLEFTSARKRMSVVARCPVRPRTRLHASSSFWRCQQHLFFSLLITQVFSCLLLALRSLRTA